MLIDDDLYIGATTNSLRKRLHGHSWDKTPISRSLAAASRVIAFEIDRLEVYDKNELDRREQFWITELKPELNTQLTGTPVYRDNSKRICKGGVTFNGVFYNTRKLLWRAVGKTLLGTFRTRLHHYPGEYAYALGLTPSPFKKKSKLV